MTERSFGIIIPTHGRPETSQTTVRTLRRAGYNGRIWMLLDDEDETRPRYEARFGASSVLVFSKHGIAPQVDTMDLDGSRAVVVYARQAIPGIAAGLGLTHVGVFDDDYDWFRHRYPKNGTLGSAIPYRLDAVLDAMCDFVDDTGSVTIAMAQGGDLIGGLDSRFGEQLIRKAMNSFIFRVDNPPQFYGRINEDTTGYVLGGQRGELWWTVMRFILHQKATQQGAGGLTDAYLESGTYRKSFYSVMAAPSCVTVRVMGVNYMRMHHRIEWQQAAPVILAPRWRKPRAEA